MNANKPFMLLPAAKDYLWGGSRLNDDFNLGIPVSPFAEAWACSTHPDGESRVASGPLAGETLPELVTAHPEILGTHARENQTAEGQIPILIKLIDANRDLSVQVHPDDAYAREHGKDLSEIFAIFYNEKLPKEEPKIDKTLHRRLEAIIKKGLEEVDDE